MVVIQKRSKRKPSGGRYTSQPTKRIATMGNIPANTKVGKQVVRSRRTVGGKVKSLLLNSDQVNLFDPKAKKAVKTKIKTIVENPANRHFVRRNILTKGAVVETEKGYARITSRPGQGDMMNAVAVAAPEKTGKKR
ncbi:30S ribosomal protein S8e [Candidatus Woesearchaeota archaeon]|nr:30S ribosomal protein S8e [Candidatus Woesearchaeota archaeon]